MNRGSRELEEEEREMRDAWCPDYACSVALGPIRAAGKKKRPLEMLYNGDRRDEVGPVSQSQRTMAYCPSVKHGSPCRSSHHT